LDCERCVGTIYPYRMLLTTFVCISRVPRLRNTTQSSTFFSAVLPPAGCRFNGNWLKFGQTPSVTLDYGVPSWATQTCGQRDARIPLGGNGRDNPESHYSVHIAYRKLFKNTAALAGALGWQVQVRPKHLIPIQFAHHLLRRAITSPPQESYIDKLKR
jgi:hypothetical protein